MVRIYFLMMLKKVIDFGYIIKKILKARNLGIFFEFGKESKVMNPEKIIK